MKLLIFARIPSKMVPEKFANWENANRFPLKMLKVDGKREETCSFLRFREVFDGKREETCSFCHFWEVFDGKRAKTCRSRPIRSNFDGIRAKTSTRNALVGLLPLEPR